MKLSLQIPDEVYDAYAKHSERLAGRGNGHSASPEDMMAAQLSRFAKVAPMDRVVILDSASRDALETLLSGGAIHSGADLLKRVQQLADLEIGGVRVEFTTKEWEQIRNYATRNGLTVQGAAESVVAGLHDQFFDIAG